ncbi:MAG TPA: ATP-binding cassette domain-containing protein [Acidimicrobiales bacterium]|nr:ATP-binding cassette domain-containing protein [Acidimicrobiales bacterium]
MSAGYGGATVIEDISLSVGQGQVSCVIGPNGAGKSTLLRAVTRDADLVAGRVYLDGEDISESAGNDLVRRGLAWVPQLDDVFSILTVRENLELGAYSLPKHEVRGRLEEVIAIFPLLGPLTSRVAGQLSGGERKLLAIGRALMPKPSAVLLDEPTAGLSPEMTKLVLETHVEELRASGVAVLLVEQRGLEAIAVSSEVHVMIDGRLKVSSPSHLLRDGDKLARLFLGEDA